MSTTTPATAPDTPQLLGGVSAIRRPKLLEIAPTVMLLVLVAGISIVEPGFLKPKSIQQLGNQFPLIFVLALGQMTVIFWFTEALRGRIIGIPNLAILSVVIGVIYAFILNRTTFGRHVYAVGNGQRAASLSGFQPERTIITGFALSGFFAGLAAMVMVSQLLSASSTTANALLLPVIAAVILGGNAITGGVGGVGRTFIGALIITVLRVGLDVAKVNASWQPIIFGLLAVVSVAVTIDRSRLSVIK